jgi:PAS domain S-box-containing protein
MAKGRILVIDDEPGIREMICFVFQNEGYELLTAQDGREGIKMVSTDAPDVVISDIKMPGMDGISALKEIKNINPDLEVILSTGFANIETAIEGLRAGAFDFVKKPFDIDEIRRVVARAFDKSILRKTINELNQTLRSSNENLERLKNSLEEKVQERTRDLSKTQAKYKSVIENSYDPIITLDSRAKITGWNKGAECSFGFSREEALGRQIDTILLDGLGKDGITLWDRLKTENFVKNYIMHGITRTKEEIYFDITASNIEGEGVSVILRDITREKKIEQMKVDFVSNLSHELRTPLTSINGSLELIQGGYAGSMTDEQKEFLNIISKNMTRLTGLVNDLLDLSVIQSGKVSVDLRVNDFQRIIDAAINAIKPTAEKKKVAVAYRGPGAPVEMLCDEVKIKQVLTNILGNAIKFTSEEGSVFVEADKRNDEFVVKVIDTGIGIAREQFERIFEAFTQVDSSPTRSAGGAGLGLSISKSIIDAHKGRIWVESSPGKGSAFFFSLPAKNAGADTVHQPSPPAEKTSAIQRIMVVEDDDDVARVIRGHLEKEGFEVAVVSLGAEVIKRASDFKPQLITLDILLSDISGRNVGQLLKNDPDTRNVPIVIISAVLDKAEALEFGAKDYIPKPVEFRELLNCINRIGGNL